MTSREGRRGGAVHPALQGANKGRRVVKTSTDEHQSAQHLAVRARLASYPVVYRKSYSIQDGRTHLGAGFPLRCFQRLSVPDIATLHVPLVRQQGDQRSVHSGPLVLGATPLKYPRLLQIGDRPVLRRSEPSSRPALIGEQPNPWNLLQLQDVMSRHRGAKQRLRYELFRAISLLSLA